MNRREADVFTVIGHLSIHAVQTFHIRDRSRQQINEAVRAELRKGGGLAEDGQTLLTLTYRSDMTGAGRTWAARYNPGELDDCDQRDYLEGARPGVYGEKQGRAKGRLQALRRAITFAKRLKK